MIAGGHRNKFIPDHHVYSTVASCECVRLTFILAHLNGLKVMVCDIGNSYLNAPNRERVHVKVGKELFEPENEGKQAVICCVLYGLKTASAAWRNHFHQTIIQVLGYESTVADPDVYRRPKAWRDGSTYYLYLVVYVDDVLYVDEEPRTKINMISNIYRVKPERPKIPGHIPGNECRKM